MISGLIQQIINGDTNSFSVLVDRYKDLVFTLALRMVKNREEAEEVSQDTFIKAFKYLDKFKGDSKFSTWIYKVAYNTCLDRIKKYKKEQLSVPIDEFTEKDVRTVETAYDVIEKQEKRKAIKDCLEQLPSDDAFLLTLFYFEEQSLDEISAVIGLTANNVKVKLFRSRKKLAAIMKQRLEAELINQYLTPNKIK